MAKEYIVTLVDKGASHLKAIADDGIHGEANCQFPSNIYGISRGDFANEGVQFAVSNLTWTGKFYRVNRYDVLGVISPEKTITKEIKPLYDKSTTPYSSTSTDKSGSIESEPSSKISASSDRRAAAAVIPDDFFEDLRDKDIMNSPLVKLMRRQRGQKMKESFSLNESLFVEADDFSTNVFPNFFDRAALKTVSPETLNMMKSPFFGSGKIKIQARILVELYRAIIDPGTTYTYKSPYDIIDPKTGEVLPNKGITRSELLKRCGIALYATPAEQQTSFNDFRKLGLAYINPNRRSSEADIIFAGSNLVPFIQGKIREAEYGNPEGLNLEPESELVKQGIEKAADDYAGGDRKAPTSAKTRRPDLMDPFKPFTGIKKTDLKPGDLGIKKPSMEKNSDIFDTDITDSKIKSSSLDRRAAAQAIPADFFEELESKSDYDTKLKAQRYELEEDKKYQKEYKEYKKLPADFEINEDNFDEPSFRHMCSINGWNYNRAYKGILGKEQEQDDNYDD